MLNIREHTDLLNLDLDETHRGDCPACKGHNTFTATRIVGKIIYNCYKAGCTLCGSAGSSLTVADSKKLRKEDVETEFKLLPHIVKRGKVVEAWAYKKMGFPEQESTEELCSSLFYDVIYNRIVFPVYIDHVLKDAAGRALHKSKVKWWRYGRSQYAYTSGSGNIAVVVEDCISAAMVALLIPQITGIALLGTHMTQKHIQQLQKFDGIIVALDPDAAQKTLKLASQLTSATSGASVKAIKLQDDLKYKQQSDLQNLTGMIYGIRTAQNSY